jgi:glycosyltransferase involved in cell wall biosynthesis
MNILRIVYDWPDENTITEGLAPAPYELSVAQAQLGNKIFVLCGNLNGKNLKAKRYKYEIFNGKITVFNLPRALTKLGPFFTTSVCVPFYYFYLKRNFKIDIVHNHGHLGVWFLVYKFLFGLFDRTPVIGHYHNTAKGREAAIIAQGQKVPALAANIEYPIHKFSDFLMTKVAKQLMVVSANLGEELVKYYHVPKEKITLLESSVDTNRFIPNGSKINFGFEEGSIIIGNGGRLSKRKNIDMLINAMMHLPLNYKLILWGTWDEELKHKMTNLISSKNMWDRVKYMGSINYFNVDKYYRSVDLFVLPSSYEGLPKVVMEALACGCKVLASGFTIQNSIPNLSLMDATGLSATILANNITDAMSKPEDDQKTHQILETHYSWKSKAELLEKIYNKYI